MYPLIYSAIWEAFCSIVEIWRDFILWLSQCKFCLDCLFSERAVGRQGCLVWVLNLPFPPSLLSTWAQTCGIIAWDWCSKILLSMVAGSCAVNRACKSSWTQCTAFDSLTGGILSIRSPWEHSYCFLSLRAALSWAGPLVIRFQFGRGIWIVDLVSNAHAVSVPGAPGRGRRRIESRGKTTMIYKHILM